LESVVGKQFDDDGDHSVLLTLDEFAVSGGELIGAADLPGHALSMDVKRYRFQSISS